MKVNDPTSIPLSNNRLDGTQATGGVERKGHGRPERAGGSDSSDQVHLSSLAESVRSLSSNSPERAARLEKLSAEVEAGRYRVDANVLSQRLVEETIRGGADAPFK